MPAAAVKRLVSDPGGFTLFELIVAVSIISTVLVLVAPSTFQILSIQRDWQDEIETTRQLRNAGAVFAPDALNAASTTIPDLSAPTTTVSLSWTSVFGTTTKATYTLFGGAPPMQLKKELFINDVSQGQRDIARDVVSAGFSRSGKLLTFDIAVQVGTAATTSKSFITYLRSLK